MAMTRLMRPTKVSGLSRNLLGRTSRLRLPGNVVTRRGMASGESHAPSASSDTPWIIASAVIFGPSFLYLLGPGSAKAVTGHGDSSKDSHPSGHGSAPPPLMQKVTPQQQEQDEPASEPEPTKSEPEKEDPAATGESEDSKADQDESQAQPLEKSTESPPKDEVEKVAESDATASDQTSANNDANSEQSQKDEPEPSQGETTGDGDASDSTK